MKLVWSPVAVEDLEAAVNYIDVDLASPHAAKQLLDSIIEKAQLFADVPGAGTVLRTVSGIDTGYRYVMSGNWMIFLECAENEAIVVRVLYAKSDYLKKLLGTAEE